jgi:hypothetical protein
MKRLFLMTRFAALDGAAECFHGFDKAIEFRVVFDALG